MQTKIRLHPELAELRIGDQLAVNWQEIPEAGYLAVYSPEKADAITILETWECPSCDKPFNWARIKIENGRIKSIHETELTTATLLESNYISDESKYLLDSDDSAESTLDALIKHLSKS